MHRLTFFFTFLFIAATTFAQNSITIKKFTNGQDADAAPGPAVAVGSTVTWTYIVTNTGSRELIKIAVTDDQGVVVSCPGTTLDAGTSFTCTATGTAVAGQYTNVGTVTAEETDGSTATASDPSHYFGQAAAAVSIEKRTNGFDADTPPGPPIPVGSAVNWTYVITNLSAGTLSNIAVTDDQGVSVSCPGTTLAPGASMTCTASGVAQPGQYANVGTVTAMTSGGQQTVASDASHYFGQVVELDFGDAPDPTYPTLFASDGARHVLSTLFLGNCVDSEADALAGASANGDDAAVGTSSFGNCATPGDDEDGVTFTTPLATGQTAGVDVVASEPCTLSAWIDFNRDGDWADAGESLFSGGAALVAGTNSLTFPVPASASSGPTFARFRCTTDGPVSFTGLARDGEVEDYAVTLITLAPAVSATKNDALLVDVDHDGLADPGDTLRYTVVITNSGNSAANGVTFSDTPDANTALVVGSVTTSAGTVTSGNNAGATSVGVNVGTLAAAGGTATITFDVVVRNPVPPGTTQVSNQGTVAGSNFNSVPTDDPAAPGNADPTVTSLSVPPAVSATKNDALQNDVDHDGNAEPGDTVRYTVVITNSGNGNALSVVFNDPPDPNTTLVNGSVTTSAGTVTTGNGAGDSTVSVNAGTIAALGGSVTITFDVVIKPPPPLVSQIVNSGTVSGSNFTPVATDDPSQPGSADPTVTPIAPPNNIPTLQTWALIVLAAMLGWIAVRRG